MRLFPFGVRMTAKCVSNECREQNTVTYRGDQTGGPSVRELVLADIASYRMLDHTAFSLIHRPNL